MGIRIAVSTTVGGCFIACSKNFPFGVPFGVVGNFLAVNGDVCWFVGDGATFGMRGAILTGFFGAIFACFCNAFFLVLIIGDTLAVFFSIVFLMASEFVREVVTGRTSTSFTFMPFSLLSLHCCMLKYFLRFSFWSGFESSVNGGTGACITTFDISFFSGGVDFV